jgi:hypothetical protein
MSFLKMASQVYDRFWPGARRADMLSQSWDSPDAIIAYLSRALADASTANGWTRGMVVEQLRTDANVLRQIADGLEAEPAAVAYSAWLRTAPRPATATL